MMSGRIASLAAAATGLVGTSARRNSVNGGTSPVGWAVASAPRNAARAASGNGNAASRAGVTKAAIAADAQSSAIIVAIARTVSRPALAICAVRRMPVTSSVTTSGTTVICSPRSQSDPTTSAPLTSPGALPPTAMPRAMPMARATRTRRVFSIQSRPLYVHDSVWFAILISYDHGLRDPSP